MLGATLYRGLNTKNDREVLVVATNLSGRGGNTKVGGGTIQTYTLVADTLPSTAVGNGDDRYICGNCPHRAGAIYTEPNCAQVTTKRSCYVTPAVDGVDTIWRNVRQQGHRYYQACLHPRSLFDGRTIRICQYGDPAFAPFDMWERLVGRVRASGGAVIGYTHQWRNCDPRFRRFLMASVDNLDEMQQAHNAGWLTARTVAWDWGERPQSGHGEFTCPATDQAYALRRLRMQNKGKPAPRKISCEDCRFCDGTRDGTRSAHRGVVFPVHGCSGRAQAYYRNRGFE